MFICTYHGMVVIKVSYVWKVEKKLSFFSNIGLLLSGTLHKHKGDKIMCNKNEKKKKSNSKCPI